MSERVACPRCGQEWLSVWRVARNRVHLLGCAECDAVWESIDAVKATRFWKSWVMYARDVGESRYDDPGAYEDLGYYGEVAFGEGDELSGPG